MVEVLGGKDGLIHRNQPIDTKTVVQDADATIGLRGIEVVALVLNHRIIAQYGKSMRKTIGNKYLTMIVLGEFYRYVLTKGGRSFANIYSDI